MESSKGRSGAGIREFLEYYLLAMLNEGTVTREKVIETIERESADNQNYRPGGALRIAEPDLEQVLQTLTRRNLVEPDERGEIFTLTDKGRGALQKMNSIKEQAKDSKEDATVRLISILALESGLGMVTLPSGWPRPGSRF